MKKKMLVLPMKKKWFDMILSGEKTEEYREVKPYWQKRVANWERPYGGEENLVPNNAEVIFKFPHHILFVNGYGINAPRFIGWCDGYSIRDGVLRKRDWGEDAYAGIRHYAFRIFRIERTK